VAAVENVEREEPRVFGVFRRPPLPGRVQLVQGFSVRSPFGPGGICRSWVEAKQDAVPSARRHPQLRLIRELQTSSEYGGSEDCTRLVGRYHDGHQCQCAVHHLEGRHLFRRIHIPTTGHSTSPSAPEKRDALKSDRKDGSSISGAASSLSNSVALHSVANSSPEHT